MIDHIIGRPNPSWKRTQVFLVILFWLWKIVRGTPGPPRILWLSKANRLLRRFTPWQIIVSTLTTVYAVRNFDKILGLNSPEPLARLYSPDYYRATWISTGLDAGFATAMSIRPKWLRDVLSIVFSAYYIAFANEADEKIRRFRAVPTVEMLRTTWEKTTNPYIKFFTHLPHLATYRKILIPRPGSSTYSRPITGYIYFARPEDALRNSVELILDFPGGGFVAMSPQHHEERLRMWALRTSRPVLSIDYGKAPEYPYPYAIDEAFDTYRTLVESGGTLIGMSGQRLKIIMSGDSAGATLAVNVTTKVLEHNALHPTDPLPMPISLVLSYAALDFNFTSWMSSNNLRVLRSEQSSGNLPGLKELAEQKDHLKHISPLSMVGDKRPTSRHRLKRRKSWKDTIRGLASGNEDDDEETTTSKRRSGSGIHKPGVRRSRFLVPKAAVDESDEDEVDFKQWKEEDRPLKARVRYVYSQVNKGQPLPLTGDVLEKQQEELSALSATVDETRLSHADVGDESQTKKKEPIGTRLTMTSRTGYFQDRIISPSMMRAMAILYIGPHRNPDFATDYYLSPILTPSHILAHFPPLLMQCGEKDPFVDDTVIFAGRVREAKRARKVELELAISGKSARFGETLRMSTSEPAAEGSMLASMKKERDRLARETDDDWVQLVLFSDWSHGYLQMPALMRSSCAVIDDLADWMDDSFRKVAHLDRETRRTPHVVAKRARGLSPSPNRAMDPGRTVTCPSPFTSGTETDDSGITFVPRKYQDRSSRTGSFDYDSDETAHRTEGDGRASTEEGHSKAETPKKVGETITETELMRRRRLLDAHIFD